MVVRKQLFYVFSMVALGFITLQSSVEAMGRRIDTPPESRIVHLPGLIVTNANETAKAISRKSGKRVIARVVNRVTIGMNAFEIGINMAAGDVNKALESGVFLALGMTPAGTPVVVTLVIMEVSNEPLKDAQLTRMLDGLEERIKSNYPHLVCHSAELSIHNYAIDAEEAYEKKDRKALDDAIAKMYEQMARCPLVGAAWWWPDEVTRVLNLKIEDESDESDDCFEKCFKGPTANNDECRKKCAE
jgi:hypothetical protein